MRLSVLVASMGLAACGARSVRGDGGPAPDAADDVLRPVGAACADDGDCETGVCWDYSDFDPECAGAACSAFCSTSKACQDLAAGAGAAFPERAACVEGECDLVATGLGTWKCM